MPKRVTKQAKQPTIEERLQTARQQAASRRAPEPLDAAKAQKIAAGTRELANELERYEQARREDELAAKEWKTALGPLAAVLSQVMALQLEMEDALRDARVWAVQRLVQGLLKRLDLPLDLLADLVGGDSAPKWIRTTPSLAEYIEPLRRRAEELAPVKEAPSSAIVPRLTDPQQQVWAYLTKSSGGKTGKQIVQACPLVSSEASLRNHIIPALKAKGCNVLNERGIGYYLG